MDVAEAAVRADVQQLGGLVNAGTEGVCVCACTCVCVRACVWGGRRELTFRFQALGWEEGVGQGLAFILVQGSPHKWLLPVSLGRGATLC